MIIKVTTLDNNEEKEMKISLKSQEPENLEQGISRVWKSTEHDVFLTIYENDDGSVSKLEKDNKIITEQDLLISQFLDQKQTIIETESSGIEFNDETVPLEEPQPYDPELIRVDTKPFSLKQTFELIEEGDIDLSPDFQRNFVWKEIGKKSRLIESIMLRIPLPVFYLSQDREGKFQVVDGLQRLTVIKQFLKNEFKLKNLEYLKDCEGCYFDKESSNNKLDPKYIRRITQTQLVMNIIDPQTPVRVKFEIFKRINLGGQPLKPQEIRNCMASTSIRKFIKTLTNSNEFKEATNYSVNPMRMEDQELILRFVGFYYIEYIKKEPFKYNGNMEIFLDDTLDLLNKEQPAILSDIKNAFLNAMNNAHHLFGDFAFRKCTKEHFEPGARKQFINKSLFTSWSVLLAQFESKILQEIISTKALNNTLAAEIESNSSFYYAITNGTNDLSRLNLSFDTARKIIKKTIEGIYNAKKT